MITRIQALGIILLAVAAVQVARAADYAAPRTSFGAPDLQGLWTNATITTLERPDDIDELILSEAQAAEMEETRQGFYDAYDEPEANADGELLQGNDPGGYHTSWRDEGTRLARVNGEIRSSLIVEPANGKIPYRLLARFRMFEALASFSVTTDRKTGH